MICHAKRDAPIERIDIIDYKVPGQKDILVPVPSEVYREGE